MTPLIDRLGRLADPVVNLSGPDYGHIGLLDRGRVFGLGRQAAVGKIISERLGIPEQTCLSLVKERRLGTSAQPS